MRGFSKLTRFRNTENLVIPFFTLPSMRNHRNQFSAISMGFPPDSRRLSIHFGRFSVIFNQFQSISVSFSQFQSVSVNSNQFYQFDSVKTQEFIDNWKVGETTPNLCLVMNVVKTLSRKGKLS